MANIQTRRTTHWKPAGRTETAKAEVAEVVEDREPSLWKGTGQEGQGLVEYGLVLLLVAVALVGSLQVYGTTVIGQYTLIVNQIP